MTTQCGICIEDIKKVGQRKRATCPYCDLVACVDCTQKYLLGTHEDPHCMGCRRGWSRETLMTLGDTWVLKNYKKHRETILLDRERARLPAAQVRLESHKLADERKKQMDELMPLIGKLRAELVTLEGRYANCKNDYNLLTNGMEPMFDLTGSKRIRTLGDAVPDVLGGAAGGKVVKEERREFIMKCPAPDCRGFLSSAYKCGICDQHTCPSCHELKAEKDDPTHTCKPDQVETVKLLKKETKPCPKCAANIFKINGCDQMYCTACNTPFSWTTGKMVTDGVIHNPHYYEYLRAGGKEVPRAPGDVPCGGPPAPWELQRRFGGVGMNMTPESAKLLDFLRMANHINMTEVRKLERTLADVADENMDVNIRYLKNEIDEKRWKSLLHMREKRRMVQQDTLQRYQALCMTAFDIVRWYLEESRDSNKYHDAPSQHGILKGISTQIDTIVNVFNNGIRERNALYACSGKTLEYIMKGTRLNPNTFYELVSTVKKRTPAKKAGGGAAGSATPTTVTEGDFPDTDEE
jgi:hypothetical protein